MVKLDEKLINDIKEYCILNNIEDITKFVNKLLKKSFMEEKYGNKPEIFTKEEFPKKEEVDVAKEMNKLLQESPEMQKIIQRTNKEIVDTIMNMETKKDHVQVINDQEIEEKPKKSKKRKLN